MGWEDRNGRSYYYRKEREGGLKRAEKGGARCALPFAARPRPDTRTSSATLDPVREVAGREQDFSVSLYPYKVRAAGRSFGVEKRGVLEAAPARWAAPIAG
jgi:hypothetical protein